MITPAHKSGIWLHILGLTAWTHSYTPEAAIAAKILRNPGGQCTSIYSLPWCSLLDDAIGLLSITKVGSAYICQICRIWTVHYSAYCFWGLHIILHILHIDFWGLHIILHILHIQVGLHIYATWTICKIICKIIVHCPYSAYFAYCNMQNMWNMGNNMQQYANKYVRICK